MRRVLLVLVLAALPAAASAEAPAASEADAQQLFERGRDAFAMGRIDEACRLFEESMRLDPANGTLLNLARCHEKQGRLEEARAEYERVAAGADRDGHYARGAVARDRAESLGKSGEGSPHEGRSGDADRIATARAEAEETRRTRLVVGVVTGSLGLASLTVGSALGAVALSDLTREDLDDDGCASQPCSPPGSAQVETAEARGDAAIALLAVGSVLAATGGTFLTLAALGDDTEKPSAPRAWLAPGAGGGTLHVVW